MKPIDNQMISASISYLSLIAIPFIASAAWEPYVDYWGTGFTGVASSTGSTKAEYSGSPQYLYVETASMSRPSQIVSRSTNLVYSSSYYLTSHLWVETQKYWGSDYLFGNDTGGWVVATVNSNIYP